MIAANRFEDQARERAEHADKLRREHLADDIPTHVAEYLYAYAYQEGHAHGWNEVEDHYVDLANLVEKAYRAGAKHDRR